MVSDKYQKHSGGELIEMIGEKIGDSERENPMKDLADAMHDDSLKNKRFLTVEEVAKILRITHATLRSWVKREQVPFPYMKIGKKILVDEDDLKEYLVSVKKNPKISM
jgi:excisionase family DNA binding protein